MSRALRFVFVRHLFLLIGAFSLGLFYLVAWLDYAGRVEAAQSLAVPMRILIIPIYLVWMLLAMAQVAIAGPFGLAGPVRFVVSAIGMILGLAPYALADYVRRRWRESRVRSARPL